MGESRVAFVVDLVFRGSEPDRAVFVEAHRTYWRRMAALGILLGGGPWRDGTGEFLLCEAPDRRTLLQVLHADPYARARVVGEPRIREWNAALGHMTPARRERPVPAAVAALTPHERRIAAMMLDGLTNKQIAASFTVSTRAVELHITRIYRKLDIRRRAQLAAVIGL
ncbi:LuxR family transcriptional regulator [Streptomyces venezuelae]|uniref:LuxR family transcriptional regulator n=1 Tax=Streptomyces venezuelae TaxID=54571 RepID=A0A5P2APF1_STRVZ|nr:LuxR family transcriptional regulator [Streptomyces venezuelae]